MKMPECERDDCRFVQRSGMSTLAYYQPIYDKNGVNINPDMNTRTSRSLIMTFSQYCLLIGIIYNVSSYEDKKFKGFMSWIWLIASFIFWVIQK